ncbi:MAG: ribonuclease T [Proteobacteria bacterium]|nr:MAG: ribonuclease T [Pseudomonadota bacterium]PIE40253.1 MAG: ribonuclease T [Gammaproteobacteria bacterium]
MDLDSKHPMSHRFRGFLPIVVDVETAGFNCRTDALLELAAIIIHMDESGKIYPGEEIYCHIKPFEGANIEQSALDFTGIDPYNPLRMAQTETEALQEMFKPVRKAVKDMDCSRAILVGHNSFFDHGFINAAAERNKIKRNPFHPFSTFDTATLAGLAYGQTVLARACSEAGIEFDNKEAHNALYDAQKTAELFCTIVNKWRAMGGLQECF